LSSACSRARPSTHLARAAPERHFFGFDSFKGLPEHWTGARYSPVNFDRRGKKPRVPANVSLIKRWFDATMPAFMAPKMGRTGSIHADRDISASTKTVLELTRAASHAWRPHRV